MSRILVTGGNGQIGSALIPLLIQTGHTVIKATSRPSSEPGTVLLNLATSDGLQTAFQGIDQAFLMCPPGYANQHELLIPAIDAAKAAGVQKIVLLSAMGANADDHIPFRRAELHLEQSGLVWNVIRPNWFMQNFHTFWVQGIREHGQIFLPVGKAAGSFIDTRDVAAVAAVLFNSQAEDNRDLDLTGSEAFDHDQIAAILSDVAGRTIGYTDISVEAMREGMLGAGVPADYTEFLLVILDAFKAGYAARVTEHVPRLLGRAPISFVQYATDHRASWL
ncbi:nucleoside-diphosphate sugar epimerase [Ahniella affigens]|uniref:Nucleoside-diphosphate sugar epimerase n=1 Tax=Ahniella affigens TaxID=2021234 RepID=A0A2P1PSH0_9GAMM|nr:SDR family oxidoreductase [Ahniella affigens]AVP97775.1 nucleoside-diphosphate sugar epimerase [Ahniella affigens]